MAPILDVQHLVKVFGRTTSGAAGERAVDDVSFSIARGETLSLVGESGSGKTTVGRCVLRLIEPTEGTVTLDGTNLGHLTGRQLRAQRRRMQMVFQDPHSSLNPRRRAAAIVEEPLIIHRIGSAAQRAARVRELFEIVGLDPSHLTKYPREFSGGERQRIGIARALALEPEFVVADEPVSALDMSVQAQVVQLLVDLQRQLGLTYLFISHDLRLVRRISDRVAVMYRGRLVEVAPPEELFTAAAHDYTKALLSAMPTGQPGQRRRRVSFDVSRFRPEPLREIAPGHFAAV
jgi:peptide/nickel transport system ATP-binding protein/oligopeptide transport system ATP-binding protein